MGIIAALGKLFGRKATPASAPPPPAEPLHWRPNPRFFAVACRAEGYLRWTGDYAHPNLCDVCRKAGASMYIQWQVNNR